MNYVALLGAGFSRNWGGWLASEAFEYLLGCSLVDSDLKDLLWRYRLRGGFEGALGHLQSEYLQRRDSAAEQRLGKLEAAVAQMFNDMDSAFAALERFEPQGGREYLVATFLAKFDAIFTLNQDLLLERHYLNGNVGVYASRRPWNGWQLPGLRFVAGETSGLAGGKWWPLEPEKFKTDGKFQPYFKLHGSSNWVDASSGRPLLIAGGNKPLLIKQHPILQWTHDQFGACLSEPDTRLMVIGYSFGDDHINGIIRSAVGKGTLRLFLIDPLGVEVIDENRRVPIYAEGPLFAALHPHVIGASRRSMQEIFGTDRVEHGKVMRFFE